MNAKNISIAAILLWLISASALGFKFFTGSTEKALDGRSAVVVSHSERVLVLSEMRTMLAGIQGILLGMEKSDVNLIETSAVNAGTKIMVDLNPELMMKLPAGFKSQGIAVHKGFDAIAEAARSGKSKDEILKMVNSQLSSCVACHNDFQLKGE